MKLRHYQKSAIEKILDYVSCGKEKGILVIPTGCGKSLIISELCRTIIADCPYVRIAVCTHSQELVKQDYDEILEIWPECPCGIYSSGLKRKEAYKQILFCGIQSVYNKSSVIGRTDIIIVDECHTISRKSESMWGQFFADAKAINPNVQIMGLTATDYRLDSGNLVPHTFHGISYEYSVIDAIKDGYLCEIVSAPVQTHLKTNGVQKRGGEFVAGALERAVDTDELTLACCGEIVAFGSDRHSWLVFAAGNAHAQHITDTLISMGIDARCVTERTKKEDRRKAVEDHKAGRLKCLVNNMIFTTGYNNPRLDMIACMRPTQSEGLWVQICGRGMRLFPNKENCLLLDFGRNLDRHGPIDKIRGKAKDLSSGEGEAPLKQCPNCFEPVYAAIRICPACGHEFPPNQLNIDVKPSDSAVLSTQIVPIEYPVFSVQYKHHKGKDGKPDSMMVIYNTMSGQIREWVFFNHSINSTPYKKAMKWANLRGVNDAITLEDALQINWPKPKTITAIKDGKYYTIKNVLFD